MQGFETPHRIRFCMALFSFVVAAGLLCGCGLFRNEGEEDGVPQVEMAVFEGGFGIDWHRKTLDRYLELRKSAGRPVAVNMWGDPRVLDKMRPRVLRGSPPDLSDALFPVWKFVLADILFPLDEWLDQPAVGQENITWRESFIPGALNPFTYRGKVYGIPLVFNAWLVWYDETLFQQHGWSIPKTYAEWLDLCAAIESAGIAPIAFQGKYPQYADALFWSILQHLAGIHKVEACQNFLPGAFLDPAIVQAAAMLQDLAQRYFQKGSLTMSHTEAQMEFCNRRAAMIPCGMWLENEMRHAFPEDFRLSCFAVPGIEGGKGDSTALVALGWQAFFVYRQGGNPREAAELLKFMLSKENSREWARMVSTVSSIQGATVREEVSSGVGDALDIIQEAAYTFDNRLYDLFPTWRGEAWIPTLEKLIAGRITPEEFSRIIEESMERLRKDPTSFKPPPRPLPQGSEVEGTV